MMNIDSRFDGAAEAHKWSAIRMTLALIDDLVTGPELIDGYADAVDELKRRSHYDD